MVTPDHLCPWGIKALDLLKRNDFEIEDKHLDSMDANKAFKEENGFDETPQIWIEGENVQPPFSPMYSAQIRSSRTFL